MVTQLSPQVFAYFALILTTLILYKFCRRHRTKTSLPLPPGPIAYPIIGSLPQFLMNKSTFHWIHNLMKTMQTEIACFRIGNVCIISVTSPELACEFLKKHRAIFCSRPNAVSAKQVSNGYLGAITAPYGGQWMKMRRVLASQMLSMTMHNQFHDRRCAELDEITRYVHSQCENPINNGLVDVRNIAQHYCGYVIKQVVFSKQVFGMRTKDGGPGMGDNKHMDFSISDFFPWLEVFDLDGHKKIITHAIEVVKGLQDREVDKRIEMWKEESGRKEEEDVLDMLINLKDSKNKHLLTSEEIKAQINEIMIASVDNPSNAVEWCLAEMINQPTFFEKACQELDEVVSTNRLVEESDLPKLNYIKACVKESFRLHPIAPFSPPYISLQNADVAGYFIPKGSHLLISRYGLGHNPRIWEDPLRYNPDRHIIGLGKDGMEEEVSLADPELCVPSFSTGRRGCPGVMLGSTLTTMLLARLIQGFEWRAAPHGPPTIELDEGQDHLLMLMDKPLVAQATPRLNPEVYMHLFHKDNDG